MTWTVYDKTGNTARCEVNKLEYSGEWMGECFVTVSVTSPAPIDFAIGDYLEYRGERFEINYDPTVIKKARNLSYGGAFTYDSVKFNSLSDELTRCDFLDYVKSDNLIHYSSLPKFSFFAASVQDLADRIQANLDRIYTGDKKWTVTVHDEFEGNTDVNIQVDCITVWDALGLAHSRFGANFIIRGRTITIGTAGIPVGSIFKYGKGNGLTQTERTAEQDQKIVTRLRAYGSTRNLPDRYYALLVNPIVEASIQEVQYGYEDGVTLKMANIKLPFDLVFLQSGEYIPVTINGNPYQMKPSGYPGQGEVAMTSESQKEDVKEGAMVRITEGIQTSSVPMQYKIPSGDVVPDNMAVQNLMLPGFPDKTLDPYIDSGNIGTLGVREGNVYFDGSNKDLPEIFPSMEGMTAEELEDAGISVSSTGALDEVVSAEQLTDNGAPDEAGEIAKGTFTVTLKDVGFDINDYLTSETAVISMKSGMCAGRDFEIASCENSENNYVLTCNRVLDDGLRLFFPYKDYNIEAGDKFVLLNITMPDVYIKAASQRLKTEAEKWLSNNDYVRYSYTPEVDNVYMARQHDDAMATDGTSLHDTLKEGDIFLFEDDDIGINGSITIDKLIIREGYGPIPQYDVVLREEKVVGALERIQNQIDSIAGGNGGGGYTSQQLEALIQTIGSTLFLSKTRPDQTNYLIKFLGGLISDRVESTQFATGFLGSGFTLKMDENGDSYLEVDRMLVRKVATFVELLIQELRHVGGQILLTPASMKCSQVEEHDTFYRCYFETTDGKREIFNEFAVGDQARCQTFNVKDEANETLTDSGLEIEDGSGLLLMEDGSLIQQEEAETERSGSVYYWRLVVGVGDNYIDLSKTDCDSGSMAPEAGDDIVQLGNRNDVTRQTAIVLSAYGNDAPYIKMYRGIDSYNLTGKEFFSMSHSAIDIVADSFRFRTGENVKDLLEAYGDELEAQTDELEKMASDNYISPVEKTSLKQQMADIESEYLQITGDAELYDVSTTSYAAAYEKAIASLGKYTADTPEYIPVENDFQDIADYYEARQVILMLLDSAKNDYVLEVSNSVKAELKVTTDAITAEVNSVKTVVEGMNEDVSNALLDAQDAKEAAESAKSEAIAAQDRLDDWSADGVISPTEKQSLRDEISRIDADHEQIADGYSTYVLGTPSTYNTAYTNYRSVLVTLTASTPETITIPSYFETRQETYYQRRAEALSAIASAAKSYADDAIAEAEGSMTTTITNSVLNVVEGQITAEVNEATYELDQKIEENSSEITLLSNQISSKVSRDEFNEQGELISEMQSEIEMLPDRISLTLSGSSNPNLIRNSGMYDTDGWIANGSPSSVTYDGYECMRCTSSGSGRYTNTSRNVGPLPSSGTVVTVSCDVYVTRACYLYLGFENRTPSVNVSTVGEWTRVSHQQTLGSSNGNFCVYLMSSSTTAYFKNVKLEVGGKATMWTSTSDQLYRTGIDITNEQITLTANKFLISGTDGGTPIAVFKNVGGTPVLQAPYIDVDNLAVKNLDGANGTFYKLECLDTYGNVQGNLRFSEGFWIEDMDIWHQGSGDDSTIGLRFWTQNLFCRRAFGARSRTSAIIYSSNVEMHAVYGNSTYRDSYSMSTRSYDGHTVYTVPCFGSGNHTSGMPVDTFMFYGNYGNTYYEFDLWPGQRIVVFNLYNSGNQRYIYINGDPILINGGQAVTIQQTNTSFMTPSVSSSVPGAGQYIISSYDNNW